MQINDNIHGFTVTRMTPAPNSGSELIEMKHDKTGARLIWLKNDGENKLFSVAFRTPPKDDTGIFHILEHSVLGGSKKYPVKEPFLELMKGTMNTFLNAMTYPDKTVFPVSSRNDTDFMNLTKVYLDAVFDPAIYYNPNIFYQEGWHIEMRSKSDKPVYKGVVFNEMKGAMSSIYSRIETELMNVLFPDTCYRFESGGLPEHITDLTYEQFIEGHKTYYHPSNSYIFLDGPIDIAPVLELIDGEYLSRFDKRDTDTSIPFQKTIAPTVKKCYYEISQDEDDKNHTYLVTGKVLGSWEEREKVTAASILAEALTGSNDAPLKRAILDTGLCLDASLEVSDGVLQPFGFLCISNTDEESCAKLKGTVRNTAAKLCKDGIDRELLRAAINRLEFKFRAGKEPRGLTRNTDALSAWLYGGDPLCYLELGEVYDSLRSKLDTDYFEKLLHEWLIDENGMAEVYMLPSRTYGEEQKAAEEKRLADVMSSLACEEIDVIIEQNKKLDEWQKSVDTPEQLATMPHLALSEVSEDPLAFETHETNCNGVTVLRHPASDKGIAAVNLYFSLADCTEQELSAAAAISELYGSLPTSKSSAAEIQRRVTGLLGSISYNVNVFSAKGVKDKCKPFLSIKARFLEKNTAEALSLISEIITDTQFNDNAAICELLKQADDDFKHHIMSNGHSYSMNRVRASLSAESAVTELVSGYEGYKRLHSALNAPEKLIDYIKSLSKRVVCSARLTASITDGGDVSIEPLISALPVGTASACEEMSFTLDIPERQGVIIPSGISYTAMAFPDNSADTAVRNVLFRALSLEYLWNEVRVKGGAYGTGAMMTPAREQAFYSYRDPSPKSTIETFRKAADFTDEYCSNDPDITQYIISSIAKDEPLYSDGNKSIKADGFWFRGISYEERKDIKKNMLKVTPKQLAEAAEKLRNCGNICVFGNEAAMQGLDLTVDTLA
ncbi:MAG: insulinase family protein [Ruminococcus sp.]|uniref:insulinase family protein n=1 Tax=Ruminococcus sp. TaxID=41978 RepID=UPI0025F47A1C|nr:insulinase family protein [Ruminococcus sp.]MCR4794517.1 insulinase family protein [Ruminococcus sp.]